MKIPDGVASLPSPPSRDRTVNFETLSKVDWTSVFRFREQLGGNDDEEPPLAGETYSCSDGTGQVTTTRRSDLLRCCPPIAVSIENRKPRRHDLPMPRNSNVSNIGALSHGGCTKPYSCPIISHPGLSKAAIKALFLPSIIHVDFARKKKPQGYDGGDPTSPEVSCLGQVKDKEKQYKQARKTPDKKQTKTKKKKPPCSPFEKEIQLTSKQSWAARQSMEQKRASERKDLDIDSGRFSSDLGAVPSDAVYSRGERGALLTAALVHVLAEIRSKGGEAIATEYEPQVPPRNSLLLIRARRNLARSDKCRGLDEPLDIPVPRAQQKVHFQRQAPLLKTTPEVCIWKRRSFAQPSALNVRRPIKLQIKEPVTR